MCSTTSSSLTCGVTSSAMPEKNGVSVTSGVTVVPAAVLVLVDSRSVMKYSSLPTLITAFWLLRVDTRGLDSTCTSPWVLSNSINALKSLVLSKKVLLPPNAEVAVVTGATRLVGSRMQRSEEHTSELQSLLRLSYALVCL